MRNRIVIFISIVQGVLILTHAFVYSTWADFHYAAGKPIPWTLRLAAILLSFSFVTASMVAWRSLSFLARAFYTLAAVWMGFLNFFFLAAFACWFAYGVVIVSHLHVSKPEIVAVLFGLAVFAGIYAIFNAAWTRVHRVPVKLPNLPESWRGRVAALVSDTHLGHVRNVGFMRRVVRLVNESKPDVVFIVGDLYDGTMVDVDAVARPLEELRPPLGTYFVTGNHEEFSGHERYVQAVQKVGVRVLDAEKIEVDGLQVIGVYFVDAVNPARFRAILQRAAVDRSRASILLAHAPDRLDIAEDEGVSLQLSGHTHGGQMPPFSWLTRRVYGKYIHGLQRFGRMLVYTNWGAGTWGPPMRLGTQSEIVLLRFE